MQKFHNLISLAFGLVFLIVMQEFSWPIPIFRFLIPAYCVFLAAAFFYNRWYLKKIDKYNLWVVLRFLLLLLAAFGIFFFIPSTALRGSFLVVTVVLIAFFEYFLGHFAENLLLNETLIIAFGFFFAFAAACLYYPKYTFIAVMGIFVSIFLLTRAFHEFVSQPSKIKTVISLLIALFCSELFWALSFLPLHFSALAIIAFNVFYFCLVVNYYYLFHILTFKKVQFHLALIALCTLLVLIATPWNIIT